MMSETLSSIEFNKTASPSEVLDTVMREGAAAIHDFVPSGSLVRAANVLERAPMILDDNPNKEPVDRHHWLIQYGYNADYRWPVSSASAEFAPEPVFSAAQKVSDYMSSAPGITWKPNEMMGHRYEEGDYIRPHRDSLKALGFVAVLTVQGSQEFHFERDTGEEASVEMNPGTLTIMRGYQPGYERTRHWVPEATERRLAISLRQMRIQW